MPCLLLGIALRHPRLMGIMSLRVSQGPGLPQGILLCVRKSNCQACVPVNVTLPCSQRACLAGVLATVLLDANQGQYYCDRFHDMVQLLSPQVLQN